MVVDAELELFVVAFQNLLHSHPLPHVVAAVADSFALVVYSIAVSEVVVVVVVLVGPLSAFPCSEVQGCSSSFPASDLRMKTYCHRDSSQPAPDPIQ